MVSVGLRAVIASTREDTYWAGSHRHDDSREHEQEEILFEQHVTSELVQI